MDALEIAAAKGRNEVRKLLAGTITNGALALIIWGAASIYARIEGVLYPLWIGVGIALILVACSIVRYIEPEEWR